MKHEKLLVRALSVSSLCLVLSGCGNGSDNVGTNSNGGMPPSINLSVSDDQIARGDSVLVSWTAEGAEDCNASGGWSGAKGTEGSEVVGPFFQDTTISLSCSGASAGAVKAIEVFVSDTARSELALDASPETIAVGDSTTLRWSSPNADSCRASGGWSGARALVGSETVGPIYEDTTYQLMCDGSDGTSLAVVTVRVADKQLRWQAPTQNADGSPLNDLAGYVIYWGTSSRNYTGSYTINSPNVTEWEATVEPGEYYFALTAFDSENNESGYSNELRKLIP